MEITLRFSPKADSGILLEIKGKGCRVFESMPKVKKTKAAGYAVFHDAPTWMGRRPPGVLSALSQRMWNSCEYINAGMKLNDVVCQGGK